MKWLPAFLFLFWLPCQISAQYNLEEFGVELGPGLSLLMDGPNQAVGPAFNANAFFSHYACGKGYGFHLNAGATGMFPSTADGSQITYQISTSPMRFSIVSLDVAALGKLRIHEYHRPREWAVFFGPRLQVPLLARYSNELGNGPLSGMTEKVSRILPGIELSMQFRRPVGKKKSWFIHPGAAYFFLPAFKALPTAAPKPLYFFLNFGYALWDQRG
ncbi:MAG: hypothetical protein RLZZ519_68 [Bacteroidota bacterium]|jgi:hypothetical protein